MRKPEPTLVYDYWEVINYLTDKHHLLQSTRDEFFQWICDTYDVHHEKTVYIDFINHSHIPSHNSDEEGVCMNDDCFCYDDYDACRIPNSIQEIFSLLKEFDENQLLLKVHW